MYGINKVSQFQNEGLNQNENFLKTFKVMSSELREDKIIRD